MKKNSLIHIFFFFLSITLFSFLSLTFFTTTTLAAGPGDACTDDSDCPPYQGNNYCCGANVCNDSYNGLCNNGYSGQAGLCDYSFGSQLDHIDNCACGCSGGNCNTCSTPPPNCGTPQFQYNECVSCNTSRPVYQDSCGAWSTGSNQTDTGCGDWCSASPPPSTPPPSNPPPASPPPSQPPSGNCGGANQPACCNNSQVNMNINPNPVNVNNSVTFSLSGNQGSTYPGDTWSGGVNCSGDFWGSKTCTAQTGGSYTWTHRWKNCAPNNCGITSDQCSKPASYTVNTPAVNHTPTGSITQPANNSQIAAGTTLTVSGTGYDQDNNLRRVEIYAVKQSGNNWTNSCPGTISQPFCLLGASNFSSAGSGTVTNNNWTPAIGTYYIVINAFDSGTPNLFCSGNIFAPNNWTHCGTNGLSILTVAPDARTYYINATPKCANGNTPSGSTQVSYTLWPGVPWDPFGNLIFYNDSFAPGTHNVRIDSSVNYQNIYVRLVSSSGDFLRPTGTPPNSNIEYATYFNFSSPMWFAKWRQSDLPSGTYNINYLAPDSMCAPPLYATCTGTATGSTVEWIAYPQGGIPPYTSYTWSGSDGFSDTSTPAYKTYATSGTKTASVTIISSDGQTTTSPQCSVVATVYTPWIRATGDVHSNIRINATGGP